MNNTSYLVKYKNRQFQTMTYIKNKIFSIYKQKTIGNVKLKKIVLLVSLILLVSMSRL